MIPRSLLRIVACALAALPLAAADFATGMEAFRQGDYAAAIAQWRPLAEAGMVEAQFNLGLIHADAAGTAGDPVAAERWFRAAAEQGFRNAQFNLGRLYEGDAGIEANLLEAYKWLKLAEDGKVPGSRKRRKSVARRMTSKEIALADLEYREWKRRTKAGS